LRSFSMPHNPADTRRRVAFGRFSGDLALLRGRGGWYVPDLERGDALD
jgi:hypothetical protein